MALTMDFMGFDGIIMGLSWDHHGDSANQKLSRLNNLALWGGQLGGQFE